MWPASFNVIYPFRQHHRQLVQLVLTSPLDAPTKSPTGQEPDRNHQHFKCLSGRQDEKGAKSLEGSIKGSISTVTTFSVKKI